MSADDRTYMYVVTAAILSVPCIVLSYPWWGFLIAGASVAIPALITELLLEK